MSINSKIRLTIIASAVALAAAAPSAFAQAAGTWQGGIHTDAGGTPDAPAASHTKYVMQEKVAGVSTAVNTGTWQGGFHTDPGGSPDAPAARHTKQVMDLNGGSGASSKAPSYIAPPAY